MTGVCLMAAAMAAATVINVEPGPDALPKAQQKIRELYELRKRGITPSTGFRGRLPSRKSTAAPTAFPSCGAARTEARR